MLFKISSTTLSNILQNTSKVIAPKQTMPILDYFLFSLGEDGKLTITATDLESTIVSELETDSSEGSGTIAVPSSTIMSVLRELGEQPVTVSIDEETFDVKVIWATGDVILAGSSSIGYPEISIAPVEGENSLILSSEELLSGINKTHFATSNSESRPTLGGILLDINSEFVVFVATDAHQLVRMSIDKQTGIQEPTMVIIPKKTANNLRSMLAKSSDEVKIEFGGKDIKFTTVGYTYISRVIEGRYPNYNSVIPKNNPNKIVVDRLQFLASVKRVSVCSSKGTNLVRLIIQEGKITLEAKDIDYSSSAKDHVECSYEGENCVIGLKSKNVIEMLSSLSSQDVCIEFSDPTRAIIFTPIDSDDEYEKNIIMMIMPVSA